MSGNVTLITGASSGIGAELARVFAAKGHRLALTARRVERLEALSQEIAGKGCEKPIVIACDLEQKGAADVIAAALEAASLEVEYLVNNAGFGLAGDAVRRSREEQLALIDVNIRSLTDLTLRFADQVIAHRGGILNVGSLAGFVPGPGMAAYYASKAFVVSFSEALHEELRERGVRVTALCPGPVASEFQSRSGARLEPAMLAIPAQAVAHAGYCGLMKNRTLVLPGFGNRLAVALLPFIPRALLLAAVGRFQRRRRKQQR
ncbi:MAG: SDR family oxidoreductase [Alphaproteobacteria bacterium]|nr:SDR family oxidoreductase [Alphaproteobacteria bacterium]